MYHDLRASESGRLISSQLLASSPKKNDSLLRALKIYLQQHAELALACHTSVKRMKKEGRCQVWLALHQITDNNFQQALGRIVINDELNPRLRHIKTLL